MYLPEHVLEHIDMPVETAMRLAITGGMATNLTNPDEHGAPAKGATP